MDFVLYGFIGIATTIAVLVGAAFLYHTFTEAKNARMRAAFGRQVVARVVEAEYTWWQASTDSWRELDMKSNGRVIYTFEEMPAADEFALLADLAERMRELETRRPTTPGEEEVARRMKIKLICPYQRRLPLDFTGGPVVYECGVFLTKNHMPGGEPVEPFVHVIAVPDNDSTDAVQVAGPLVSQPAGF